MNDTNNASQIDSSRSIRRLLKQRWLIVVLALILTGFGAATTGVLFQSGIHLVEDWRINLSKIFPAWIVLPLIGGAFIYLLGNKLIS